MSLGLALMLPTMLGLTAGLVLNGGAEMALLVPLVLAFFLMITAWTYYLRGWLAALMVNQRRRRAVIMGVTMIVVLISQLPALVNSFWLHRETLSRNASHDEIQAWLAALGRCQAQPTL